MRIGIDATTICDARGGRGAGIEHYTWSIVFAMIASAPQHEFFLAVPSQFSKQAERELVQGQKNVHVFRPLLPKIPFLSRHLFLPVRLLLARVDALFAPAGQIPLGWRGPSVITLHDVSIFRHPEWFPPERAGNFSTRVVVPRSVKMAKRIICVSRFTEREAWEVFPDVKNRTVVIHEGVRVPVEIQPVSDDQRELLGREDMILALGTIEPRKNLLHALQAFDRFLDAHPDRAAGTRFVLAGKQGWKLEEIMETIRWVNDKWLEPAGGDVIQLVGHVTESQKWSLLARASVLMFVSWEEGFGLPLLEALAVGTPVVASNRGSLPEIAGDVAIVVEPDDIEQMSLAIAQCVLVPDGARALQEEAKHHASQFSWDQAAEKTLHVIESLRV